MKQLNYRNMKKDETIKNFIFEIKECDEYETKQKVSGEMIAYCIKNFIIFDKKYDENINDDYAVFHRIAERIEYLALKVLKYHQKKEEIDYDEKRV